ncbi:hypothetical protein B0H16DRAFT_1882000 [Mycena metata]|uniref:Uncharacterized protein n=1 Tax=Mycena metata TaxID=1033252 RepID=A0AAD7JQ27_9AGAR|nr:hypothetical protein B0H16DRAFT_1882000 [Mycena metata]
MMSRLTRNVLRLSSTIAATYSSAKVLEGLLHKDYVSHHCFFNGLGFHNHLPHHLVAAYDMGAPPALLKLIYEDLAPTLRPINRQGEDITEANWTTRLGERKAYGSYLAFFADQISKNGVQETFRRYVMAPEANGNDALMFSRLLGGALHPFLQVGSNSVRIIWLPKVLEWPPSHPETAKFVLDMPSGLPQIANTSKGVTLLALLREVYDSPVLKPVMPYEPNAMGSIRFQKLIQNPDRGAELKRIYAKWSIDTTLTGPASDAEFAIREGTRSPKAVHQLRRVVTTVSTEVTALLPPSPPSSSPVAAAIVAADYDGSGAAITGGRTAIKPSPHHIAHQQHVPHVTPPPPHIIPTPPPAVPTPDLEFINLFIFSVFSFDVLS